MKEKAARSSRQITEITYAAGVGKEVRAHGLDSALSGRREAADRLEVLVGSPARRQRREGNVDNLNRSHCVGL